MYREQKGTGGAYLLLNATGTIGSGGELAMRMTCMLKLGRYQTDPTCALMCSATRRLRLCAGAAAALGPVHQRPADRCGKEGLP
jgi:hypothetical protein